MAYAKLTYPSHLTGVSRAKAVVHVFLGDPKISGESSIFVALSDLHSHDLLDELQNAERIGRDFIESIR